MIAENLEANRYMICLNLSWNNIQQKGGILLFEALKENRKLQIFDLSFNPVGSYGRKEVEKGKKAKREQEVMSTERSLSEMCMVNETLRHCDFSN